MKLYWIMILCLRFQTLSFASRQNINRDFFEIFWNENFSIDSSMDSRFDVAMTMFDSSRNMQN